MHEVLVLPVASFHLVFGLDWLPLISGRASSAARRVARQRKASHIVLDGEAPASFGYGLVRGRGRRSSVVLHSAAQNMARLYPSGSVAAVIPIESFGYWLVALHEGAVMARTDIVYRSQGQAQEALQVLQRAHPRLSILEAAPPNLAAIAGASDSGTALKSTRHRFRRWALYLFLVSLLCLGLFFFRRAAAPPVAQPAVAVMGAAEIEFRWRQAVSNAEHDLVVHGVGATHAVLRHFQDIPAALVGWTLTRAVCRVDVRGWRCSADYQRRHLKADNQGLMAAVPDSWQLDFPTMDQARSTWSFQTGSLPPPQRQIESVSHNRRHLQSAWQGLAPAFGRMVLGPVRPVQVESPFDAQGGALPRPAGLRVPVQRSVEVEGPLRSFSLLLPHTRAIGWRSFTLTLGQHTQHTQHSLASSRLRATLHGELYELQDEAQPATTSVVGFPQDDVSTVGTMAGAPDPHDVLSGRSASQ